MAKLKLKNSTEFWHMVKKALIEAAYETLDNRMQNAVNTQQTEEPRAANAEDLDAKLKGEPYESC